MKPLPGQGSSVMQVFESRSAVVLSLWRKVFKLAVGTFAACVVAVFPLHSANAAEFTLTNGNATAVIHSDVNAGMSGFTLTRDGDQSSHIGVSKSVSNSIAKHCLWEVPGKSNKVLLLGSMHVMKDDMYPLAPEIDAAYQRAAVVVFETDMSVLESPEFGMKLMAKATYPDGESLKKHLSPAMYSLLVSNLQSSIVSIEMLDRFKPWMAAMTLVVLELQKEGFDVQNGLDKHFFKLATQDKKSLDQFETPEFQAELFTGLTDKESEEFLGQALRDMDVWKQEIESLEKAWRVGDTKALENLLLDSFKEYPLMHRKLLLDRNRSWIPKLEQFLKGDQNVLVVVGVGHLVGKDSVVDLLTAKGYRPVQR